MAGLKTHDLSSEGREQMQSGIAILFQAITGTCMCVRVLTHLCASACAAKLSHVYVLTHLYASACAAHAACMYSLTCVRPHVPHTLRTLSEALVTQGACVRLLARVYAHVRLQYRRRHGAKLAHLQQQRTCTTKRWIYMNLTAYATLQ